jgi:predicted neuraminidase
MNFSLQRFISLALFWLLCLSVWLTIPVVPDNLRLSNSELPTQLVKPIEPKTVASHFVSNGQTRSVHVSSAVELSNGDLLGFWYGGSREGHRDVVILQSRFEQQHQRWTEPKAIISREQVADSQWRYIKKVGNSNVTRVGDRLVIVFVTVSVGGWATAHMNVTWSDDEGETWSKPKRLVTSPFFNVSTLVRNKGFALADEQTLAMPVYHELNGYWPQLLLMSSEGDIYLQRSFATDGLSLAPAMVPISHTEFGVFMRAGERGFVRRADIDIKGNQIAETVDTQVINPNASLDALRLRDGRWLMVTNPNKTDRKRLSLWQSDDQGKQWQEVLVLENSTAEKAEFSYPWILQASDGLVHVVYTWEREEIRHQIIQVEEK